MSNARNEGKIRLVRHSDASDLRPLDIFGPVSRQREPRDNARIGTQ
jgi:hypothetical protein